MIQPGYKWRILAHRFDGSDVKVKDDGLFDELVIDNWFHLEQMNDREWWIQLADARIWVELPKKGKAKVTIERKSYPNCWNCPGANRQGCPDCPPKEATS